MKNKIEKTILLNSAETYFNNLNDKEKEIEVLYRGTDKDIVFLVDLKSCEVIDEQRIKGSLKGHELKLDLQKFFKENGYKV